MIELQHNKTEKFGEIISIVKDGDPVARIRQIGKTHSDIRLEWLTWQDGKRIEQAVQFPCTSLADVNIDNVTKMVAKYNL